jgi:DNA mismatch repair protein MutS
VHVAVREAGKEVVFLHRIAEGPADRSYGIHVARLAGIPERVLTRASEVLHELESERTVDRLEPPRGSARRASEPQLPLFAPDVHPVVAALRGVRLETLTPLEALNAIAEWKRMCGEE